MGLVEHYSNLLLVSLAVIQNDQFAVTVFT